VGKGGERRHARRGGEGETTRAVQRGGKKKGKPCPQLLRDQRPRVPGGKPNFAAFHQKKMEEKKDGFPKEKASRRII